VPEGFFIDAGDNIYKRSLDKVAVISYEYMRRIEKYLFIEVTYMEEDIFDYPVDGTLDLHMFKPSEVKSALSEYLLQCRIQGILYVRIIHGKGEGVLRQIVHSYLKRCPYVKEFRTASDASSWGVTLAILEPLNSNKQ
jgi:dsDNA-specific endonuclease/ATPase MutS2